jgi:N-terminal region of glycosyl transferase group 7/N-terminal domain of galactosyltransferase
METYNKTIPKFVLIVHYRNRISHKYFFSKYMTSLLENEDYEIYFSHQYDERPFNRGAVKNIGFLAIKNKYPDDYKNITFVFHDIDTVPFDKIFNYETDVGIVKHFYGFEYALGGIVSIKGSDFEMINGYPNFWGWGMEDAILQKRCEQFNLTINRNDFYPIGSHEILHLFDGISRIINKKETKESKNYNPIDGLKTIHKLNYTIDSDSINPLDNIHIIQNDKLFYVNVKHFSCLTQFENETFHEYDLREPAKKILQSNRVKTNNVFVTNNWSNIPFYPTATKKREMVQQYGKEVTELIIQNSLQNSSKPNVNTNTINNNTYNNQYNNYNINKYSPHYAQTIGVKPKATASAYIGLGGVKY